MFGCTGTRSQKGQGSAPFPQLLAVVITARAGRAKLGAITGKARAGEQTLLYRLIRRKPDLFAGRVFVFDRNFPGHKIITAILDAGGQVVARAKSDLALPLAPGGWLADGSRLASSARRHRFADIHGRIGGTYASNYLQAAWQNPPCACFQCRKGTLASRAPAPIALVS